MNIHTISNNPGSNNTGSWSDAFSNWWRRVPLFSRFIIYASIVIYILSWFMLNYVILFCNIPYQTLNNLHLWTIFTTSFVNLSILSLLFAIWSWSDISIKLENQGGTMLFILNFFTLNALIQCVYLFLIVFISYIYPPFYRQPSAGLWPLIMALITIECLKNPEADYYFFCSFKAKYYPWILFLMFMLLNQFNIQFDVLAGILYGYLHFNYLERLVYISASTARNFENSFLFSWLKSFSSKFNCLLL